MRHTIQQRSAVRVHPGSNFRYTQALGGQTT
jgi:hypothetical protein